MKKTSQNKPKPIPNGPGWWVERRDFRGTHNATSVAACKPCAARLTVTFLLVITDIPVSPKMTCIARPAGNTVTFVVGVFGGFWRGLL